MGTRVTHVLTGCTALAAVLVFCTAQTVSAAETGITLKSVVDGLLGVIWSDWLIYFLLASGVAYSFLLRFFQIRMVREMIRLLLNEGSSQRGVSPFQALAMSISLRVGVGNIAGVATAIGFGGPGAIFWMWTLAILGASTSFIECTMAQAYKKNVDGEYRSGPAFYMEYGIGSKIYGMIFAACCIFVYGITAPGVQSNAISAAMGDTFNVSPVMTGVFVCAVLGFIIFGGVKRIARVSQVVVPVMALIYMAMALIIIGLNFASIPSVLALIFKSAMGVDAVYGGIMGSAIAWGVRRGIYSNEAGMGSAPHIAGAAEVSHPAKQGLVQAFSVYIDTLLVCTATAFMILFTNAYNVSDGTQGFIVQNLAGVEAGPVFTIRAIETVFQSYGGAFVSVAILFFAFTTIMAFSYIGETNVVDMTPPGARKFTVPVFRCVLLISTFFGTLHTQALGWAIGDVGVGALVWINLAALVFLAKKAMVILKDYEAQKKAGKDPVFDPERLGLTNMDLWMTLKQKQETQIRETSPRAGE